MTDDTFTTIDPPSSVVDQFTTNFTDNVPSADAVGINDFGIVIGEFNDYADGSANGPAVYSYLWDTNSGDYELIGVSGATLTQVDAINNDGVVAGVIDAWVTDPSTYSATFTPQNAQYFTWTDEGQSGGTYQTINLPFDSTITGINDADDIVGYVGGNGYGGAAQGFLDFDGMIFLVNVPGADNTYLTGINDQGLIAGYYYDNGGTGDGFTISMASAIDTDGTLVVADPGQFSGQVTDFIDDQAAIDFTTIAFVAGDMTVSYDSLDSTLTVGDGTDSASIAVDGNYQSSDFFYYEDANGDTEVSVIDNTWTGAGGDGLWTDAANWATGAEPVSTDYVAIRNGADVTLLNGDGNDGIDTVAGLVVGSDSTLNIGTNVVTCPGLNVGGAVINSGDIFINTDSFIVIGGDLDNYGTFETTVSGASAAIDGNVINGDDAWLEAAGGTLTLDTGNTVTNYGLMEATGYGTLVIRDDVANDGTIEANGGVVSIGSGVAITGTASVTITDGGLVDFQGSATETLDLNAMFLGAGILELDNSQKYDGTVSGYSDAAVFDLHDISFSVGTTTVTDIDPGIDGPNSDELAITDGTHTADIVVEGSGYDTNWAVLGWEYGGTIVVDPDVTVADGAVAAASGSQMVLFAGSSGTLDIADPSAFTGEIAGMAGSGDVLDLAGLDTNTTVTATYQANGTTTLTVDDPGHTSFSLTLIDDYSSTFNITFNVTSDGHGGIDIFDPVTAAAVIAAGASLAIAAPSSETVTFTGDTGALVLNDPDGFTGQIVGFTGTAPDAAHSDTIDLVGINYDLSSFSDSYNSTTGLLTVSDGTNIAHISFDDFNATLDFASDGDGGTLVTDPPAAGATGATDAAGSNAPADDWGMKFADDKIDFDAHFSTHEANGLDDGHNAMVLDNPAHDNFVFHPSLGAETELHTPHLDGGELAASHPSAQLAQELSALVHPDPHSEAVFDLMHNDILAPNGAVSAQIQHAIHAGHMLLH